MAGGAGKEGRRLYKALPEHLRQRVAAMCDVCPAKIALGEYHPHPETRRIPVVHFTAARPPLLLCVKVRNVSAHCPSSVRYCSSLERQALTVFISFPR